MKGSLKNFEVVTLAAYLLGGDLRYVDTEDIAVKANEMAPGRFNWKKYPEQINIEIVRVSLSDAKKQINGNYLLGPAKKGWMLSKNGLKFCKETAKYLKGIDLSRPQLNEKEMVWRRHEKNRMLGSIAFKKVGSKNEDAVTPQEAEAFFRIDDYITGKSREDKLTRIINTFSDDSDLEQAIEILVRKVRKK